MDSAFAAWTSCFGDGIRWQSALSEQSRQDILSHDAARIGFCNPVSREAGDSSQPYQGLPMATRMVVRSTYKKLVYRDRHGNIHDEKTWVKQTRGRMTLRLTIKRNQESAGHELLQMQNTTNATPFFGMPPGTMLLTLRGFDSRMIGAGHAVLSIDYRQETWRVVTPNNQTCHLFQTADLKYWLRGFIRRTR
jgi:hypothetical protein